MKKLFIFIGLILASLTFAQIENFSVANRQITWQKIFSTELKFEELGSTLENNGLFYDIIKDDNSIRFKFKDHKIDYKGFGKTLMSTPNYIAGGQYAGNGIVDYKDGKYRVTINNINYIYTSLDLSFGMSQSKFLLEDGTLKKGTDDFNKRFTTDAPIFDYSFSNLFKFEKYKTKNDDW